MLIFEIPPADWSLDLSLHVASLVGNYSVDVATPLAITPHTHGSSVEKYLPLRGETTVPPATNKGKSLTSRVTQLGSTGPTKNDFVHQLRGFSGPSTP